MKLITTIVLGALLMIPLTKAATAQDMHYIICGDDVRRADSQVVEAFQAANPGVMVKIEAVPWGTCQDKSLTLAAAGDPPSIAYMGSRTLKQLANNNLIVPVTFTQAEQDLYQPGVLKTVFHSGKFWSYPHAFSTKALHLNCDIVQQAGRACVAPKTWDDMYDLAKAVTDNTDVAGVGLAGKDFDNTMHQFLNYLYSNGGQVLDPDTDEVTLNSPQTIETLKFYGKLVEVAQEGPTAWERSQLKDLYNDGKIAMYIDGPWGRGQHNENINEIVVPIPAGPQGGNGSILITDSLVVFKGSGHEDLALELAQKLTTGDAQYNLDTDWGLTPILQYDKLGMTDLYYETDPTWKVFTDSISIGGPEPLIEDYKSLQTVFTSMIQGIILKDDTAENLVAIAAAELEEIK